MHLICHQLKPSWLDFVRLERDDPRIAAQSRFLREQFAGGYIEGTIQWKGRGNAEAIHPYMGAYTTMNDLIRGERKVARWN